MRRTAVVTVLVATLALFASAAFAQFPLPRPPRVPDAGDILRDQLKLRIPDLRRILEEPPAIESSFDDAVTGVPFLDEFSPMVTAPMCQLPFTGDGGFIVALPGVYELRARSYCLHAGTYGPGSGEGYLYAPLRGSLAGVIQDVLDRSMAHPEIEQHLVQSLIWGIEARAKIADMPRELRDVAEVLLERRQIRRLNGGALGMVPEELFDQAFVDVPEELRMVLEAQARLRERLRQEVYDFDALQQIAVLAGDPPADGEGPVVPEGRWSWTPDGFFIRYFPNGYPETLVQLYAPEPFTIVTDELGRIVRLVDRYGAAIEAMYADAPALSVAGDDAVTGYALAGLRLISASGETLDLPCTPDDLVLTGVPAGDGQPTEAEEALYQAAVATLEQIRELADNVPDASVDDELLRELANVTHLCDSLNLAVRRLGEGAPGASEWVNMVRRAWASELTVLLGSEPVSGALVRRTGPANGIRLALLPPGERTMVADAGLYATWLAPVGNPGGLRPFRPSRGGAMPANRGRQRLGISGGSRPLPRFEPRPRQDSDEDDPEPSGGDGKDAFNRSKQAIDWIQKGKQAVDLVTDPAGALSGVIGFGIPDYLFGKILDFNFDMWGKACEALGADPPRDDFTELATPQPITVPPLDPQQALSPEHAAALNALAQALADSLSILRAAQLCEDRLGGALVAGDDDWAMRQAAALVDYKRQAGRSMMAISRCLDDVMAAIRAAGINDLLVTPDAVRAYQERLRTEGFNADERQAAALLGIDEAELEQMRAQRLAASPEELAGSMRAYWNELAESLWWLGKSWANLPAATD